jgi:hypothetical protein
MITKRGLPALLLAVAATVAAGCGSSSSSTPNNSPAVSPNGGAAAAAAPSSSAGSAAVSSNPAVKAAVASCKQSIDSNPQVPANAKGQLEGICDKAASGDPKAVQAATRDVCLTIVKDTVPAAAQDQAKAACAAAGG